MTLRVTGGTAELCVGVGKMPFIVDLCRCADGAWHWTIYREGAYGQDAQARKRGSARGWPVALRAAFRACERDYLDNREEVARKRKQAKKAQVGRQHNGKAPR